MLDYVYDLSHMPGMTLNVAHKIVRKIARRTLGKVPTRVRAPLAPLAKMGRAERIGYAVGWLLAGVVGAVMFVLLDLGAAELALGMGLGVAANVVAEEMVRPITYPGGWNIGVEHKADGRTEDEQDYTLTPYLAVGTVDMYDSQMRDHSRDGFGNMSTDGVQAVLGHRWNFTDSQANAYAWGGAGASRLNSDNITHASGWTGARVDWENRVLMVEYQLEAMFTDRGPQQLSQQARVGYALYPVEEGQVNTWLVLEGDARVQSRDKATLTPLVRQTYGPNQWEYGISLNGDVVASYGRMF